MTVTTWSKLVLIVYTARHVLQAGAEENALARDGDLKRLLCARLRFSCIRHLDKYFVLEYLLCGSLVQEANACWYGRPQGSLFAPLKKKMEDDCWGEGKMGW